MYWKIIEMSCFWQEKNVTLGLVDMISSSWMGNLQLGHVAFKNLTEPFGESKKNIERSYQKTFKREQKNRHVQPLETPCFPLWFCQHRQPSSCPPPLFEGQGCFASREAAGFAASDWALAKARSQQKPGGKPWELDDLWMVILMSKYFFLWENSQFLWSYFQ